MTQEILYSGKRSISRFLSDTGLTTGAKEMANTADEYYLQCPNDVGGYAIGVLYITYQDTAGGTVNEYGNLNAALTNGVEVKHIASDGSRVITDYTDGLPVSATENGRGFVRRFSIMKWVLGRTCFRLDGFSQIAALDCGSNPDSGCRCL